MIRSAKNTTKKLLVEDSGIAMPISLLVFLFLTFVCMSVFALGEVIRARTELQYKVDNAAYAAALVQADSLSRIAVLNRALAWTYAQTNKRQMDYIVNRWLSESYDTFIEDADNAELAHIAGCALHTMPTTRKSTADRHTSGFQISDAMYYMVTKENAGIITAVLNADGQKGKLETQLHGLFEETFVGGSKTEKDIYALKNILDNGFSYGYYQELGKEIATANQNMQAMLAQINHIRDNMDNRINGSIAENLPHDKILLYGGSSENTSSDYFKENSDESGIFSRYKTQIGHDLTLTWNDRAWWGYDSENKCRIFYPGHLKLSWNGYGVTWVCKDGAHVATLVPTGSTEVLAGTSPASGENWGKEMKSIVLAPQMVDERFFEKNGSIVVAAKTPIPDLFGNVFGKNKFLNFRVNGNLWAVSAARAGYRNGEKYENSKFLNEDKWNLFVDDWEPMFLPVGRCWKSWDGEKFTGDDAYKVLKAVAGNLHIDISENGLKLNEKVNLDVLH